MRTLRIGASGPLVGVLQATLNNMGYYKGELDSAFGNQTRRAVVLFQQNAGLYADGVVGNSTWRALMPSLSGYTINIINPTIAYLKQKYPFVEVGSLGMSVLRKDIPYLKIGTGNNQVFYSAAIHANEWITAMVLMEFVSKMLSAYVNNQRIYGINAREILRRSSIYIAPMINPDGVDLVNGVYSPESRVYQNARAIAANFPLIPFPSGWKANINGVDLNLQFPAGWENARRIKFEQGYTKPAPRDFVGEGPLTEPEALAIYNFTLEHNFRLILAYHTQGEVIYWRFLDYNPPQARQIGERFAASSGYLLEDTPYASGFAGYKDWFIQEYNRPGYTIEAGLGVNPLPISQFDSIYQKNEGILVEGALA